MLYCIVTYSAVLRRTTQYCTVPYRVVSFRILSNRSIISSRLLVFSSSDLSISSRFLFSSPYLKIHLSNLTSPRNLVQNVSNPISLFLLTCIVSNDIILLYHAWYHCVLQENEVSSASDSADPGSAVRADLPAAALAHPWPWPRQNWPSAGPQPQVTLFGCSWWLLLLLVGCLTFNFLVVLVNSLNTKTHTSTEMTEFCFKNAGVKSICYCKQRMKTKLSLSSECVETKLCKPCTSFTSHPHSSCGIVWHRTLRVNISATCKCISGTDLLRQLYVMPHWGRSCRSNFLPHPVRVYWRQANQSQRWPFKSRCLAG